MSLINCEIYFELRFSANCFAVAIAVANQERNFTVTDTKLYIPVVTLSN